MKRRVLTGLAIGLTAVVLAPAASASVTPALSLDQSGGTQAASTVPLGMNLGFSPSGSDSPKDLTIGLPPGRAFADHHVLPVINEYWERAEFPFEGTLEIVDTYEGTDSIQSLIVRRDVTGISAFT